MQRRKKRVSRYRGSTTHGCGSMKKRRGAGNRGGRGNAGTGKRGDAKKPSVWKRGRKDPEKRGFTSLETTYETINVGHLSSIAPRLLREKRALEQGGSIVVNLRELGYGKLLGSGKVGSKLKVGVAIATPSAKEKIEAAGGTLDADVIADRGAVIAERATRKGPPEKKVLVKTRK